MDNAIKAAIIVAFGSIFAAYIGGWFTDDTSLPTNISTPIIKIENKIADSNESQQTNSNPTEVTPNQPPSIDKLDSEPSSPQTAGSIITWTTDASDPDGDRIYYQYILNGDQETGWSKENEWTWQTNDEYRGKNIIEVLVMDANHAAPSGSDDRESSSFTILPQESHENEMQEGSDYSLEQQPSQTTSSGPVRLSDLKAYYSTFPRAIKYDSAADMRIGNKEYKYGIQLEECAFLASSKSYTAYFNLNGEYSRLTGLIGLDDKTDVIGDVSVYFGKDGKDDDILLDTIKISPGDLPINIDIDVSGANKFIIEVPSISSCTRYIDLIDMELTK